MSTETLDPLLAEDDETHAGNYFVANYPPFSFWDAETAKKVRALLEVPASPETPLGVYFHMPFCRKRCHFLLFPRLHRQERAGDRQLPRRRHSRAEIYCAHAADRRPQAQVRLFRRRHTFDTSRSNQLEVADDR